MTNIKIQEISGWGRYPREICSLVRPEKIADLHPYGDNCIARGLGKSYGDAALNLNKDALTHIHTQNHTPTQNAIVVLTERLNRFLAFDQTQGILTAEAGVNLKDILDVIVPQGWFLPVTPGTQFVSLGGCLAADVHGKNHHHAGSFSRHVISFELMTADRQTIACTPEHTPALFWATAGGMGLTGIIVSVTLQLIPVSSAQMSVCYHTAQDLEQAFFYLNAPKFDDEYSVAWIDVCAKNKNRGRSIIMTGHHAKVDQTHNNPISDKLKLKLKLKQKKSFKLPFDLPFTGLFLNKTTIKLLNQIYFHRQSRKNSEIQDYPDYFYPLDTISHWHRLYGKKGFVQYQCVLPDKKAYEGIKQILSQPYPCFLAVLKRLGENNFNNIFSRSLSFPMAGMTLAMDLPFEGEKTLKQLRKFDEIVLAHQGRVYLAKDACLSADYFRLMYPEYPQWLAIKNQIDPQHVFQSSLSKRLKIGL